jgi:hypothetical protein
VTNATLTLISDHANPFFFRELYLDGCDKITSLENLVRKSSAGMNARYLAEARSSAVQISRFQAMCL